MNDRRSAKVIQFSIKNLENSLHTRDRWIGQLFDNYKLFPVIGDDEKTTRMLSSESLVKTVFKLVLRRANLSTLVNSLTGMSLLAKSKDGNLIQEAYAKIDESIELRKTINDRVKSAYAEAAKAGLAFSSVKERLPILLNPHAAGGEVYLQPLFKKIDSVDRKFVSVHGVLCRVESAKAVLGANIAKALAGSKVSWVLADHPYFVMGRPEFRHGVVLLNMNQEVIARLENALPFWSEVGWYPYVRVSGECRYPHSPEYVYPSITPSWIEYRTPKNPEGMRTTLQAFYEKETHVADAGFGVVKENPLEVQAYMDVVKMVAKGANLDVSDLRWIEATFQDAKGRADAMKASVFT